MFGSFGPMSPNDPVYTTFGLYMKQLGATKIGCVANDIPTAISDCQSALKGSVHLGLTNQYLDTTASNTQTTFNSIALNIKNSGANGLIMNYGPQQNAALLLDLAQDGYHPKALLLPSSYGQDFLSTPALVQAVRETGALLGSYFVPVQLQTKGTKSFQAALKKYEHITVTPSFQNYEGYTAVDMAITALKAGGKTPTKSSMIKAMQTTVKGDTLSGLSPSPLSWPLSKFGTGPVALGANGCNYALRIVNGKYVPLNTKPTCGTEVSSS
jgi:ABC-type branched-subunit amino acid transport system substrate-binding protein